MPRVTAKSLVRQHGIGVDHQLYRETGDWFHILKAFPGALIDSGGFLRFESQADYEGFIARGRADGVSQNTSTNTLTVKGGIARQPGYIPFADIFLSAGEEAAETMVTEGARRQITVNIYERDSSARRRCIKHWGLTCVVCAFNFKERYGELGANYIHVHHLVPVSTVGGEYELNPEADLRPVCANCHSMLHRRSPPLKIEELKALLKDGDGFLRPVAE